MQVTEDIPESLRPASQGALEWINSERGTDFAITGVIDPHETIAAAVSDTFELGLVLCSGDICAREQVMVERTGADYRFRLTAQDDVLIPPTLDPPAGNRNGWLESQLASHAFVVLVFYRGFW